MKWEQIIVSPLSSALADSILRGDVSPGDALADITCLAQDYMASPSLIRRTLQRLCSYGLLCRDEGGYTVTKDEAVLQRCRQDKLEHLTKLYFEEMASFGARSVETLEYALRQGGIDGKAKG